MDEVKAMTKAGESVGKAVGTGLRAVRESAVRAGHAGAEVAAQVATRAEQKLAERGIAPEQVKDAISERAEEVAKTTRRTRKQLAKQAERKRRELAKQAERQRRQLAKRGGQRKAELLDRAAEVRDELAKASGRARREAKGRLKELRKAAAQAGRDYAAEQPRKRRRWPWVLGLLVAAGAAGYVALSRRPQEVRLQDEEPTPPATLAGDTPAARNGQVADHAERR